MCASCGCGKVNDDHGDPRHITLAEIEQAAEAAGLSVQETINNMAQSVGEKMAQAPGPSNVPGASSMHG